MTLRERFRAHWRYGSYVMRHKAFVYRAGRRFEIGRLQLLRHDLSKFHPSEWRPYTAYFYGEDGPQARRFDHAWLRHIHRNRHHWQHWVLREDSGATRPLTMPDKYVLEMVADWVGAGQALGLDDTPGWYEKNKDKMILSDETRVLVERLIEEVESWRGGA